MFLIKFLGQPSIITASPIYQLALLVGMVAMVLTTIIDLLPMTDVVCKLKYATRMFNCAVCVFTLLPVALKLKMQNDAKKMRRYRLFPVVHYFVLSIVLLAVSFGLGCLAAFLGGARSLDFSEGSWITGD